MKIKTTPVWIYSLSTFISLLVINYLFSNSNISLNNFSDRTIGISVLQGIDVAKRSLSYLGFIVIFTIINLFSIKVFKFLFLKTAKKIDSKTINALSVSAIFILIFHYMNGDDIFVQILSVLKYLLTLMLTVLFAKIFFKKRDLKTFYVLNNYNYLILSLLLPISFFFTRWALINGSFTFTKNFLLFHFVLWIIFWITVRFFVIERKFSLQLGSVPLLVIPAFSLITTEIQYTLRHINGLTQHRILVLITFSLITLSVLIFITIKKNINFAFATKIYLPIFLCTLALFRFHNLYLDINYLDTFHHGENLISTAQLFSFNKIPFIDIYPTHGLSYMIGQVLYAGINGYHPFTPWLGEWVVKVIEILLLYLVLSKLTNSFFASILISFLPVIGIFGGQGFVYGYSKILPTTYYFFAFLPGLLMVWLLNQISFKRMLVLWISCILLAAWRVDFGIVATLSCILILLTINLKTNFKTLFRSFGLILTISLVLFGSLCMIYGKNITEILIQIFMFVKIQAQSQGLINVINNLSPIVIFQYVLLPLVGVFYILYYLTNMNKFQSHVHSKYKFLLIYLAIFSIIISVRSVQRHTLSVMGYNPYLFAFLILCIPIYLRRYKSQLSIVLFTVGLLVYQLILPSGAVLLKSGQFVTQKNWKVDESRVHLNDVQLKNITEFLNNNLEEDQTFVDLTSSPLLYVTTNREFINYLIPTAYLTSDTIQSLALKNIVKQHDSDKIPIVVYSQPNIAANFIDGVPNELRSYKIYEYIYKHYHPIGDVEGYKIWLANKSKLRNQNYLKSSSEEVQHYNLKNLPYIWARYDTKNAVKNTEILFPITENEMHLKNVPIKLKINPEINKVSGNYLYLKIVSENGGVFNIRYNGHLDSQIVFDLIKSNEPIDYLVRISTQYDWTVNVVNEISISSTEPVTVMKMNIRGGD